MAKLKQLFDAVNKYNRRPIDLAKENGMSSEVVAALRDFYSTLTSIS